jgi:hypothetical protein
MALDLNERIERTDSSGFSNILEEIVAGESAQGYGHFRLTSGTSLTDVIPLWSLIDKEGVVYSSGSAQSITETLDSFGKSVLVTATIGVPSYIPVSSRGVQYQIRWTLDFPDSPSQVFAHGVKVVGLTSSPTGASSTIELEGDKFTLNLVLDRPYSEVTADIYNAFNAKLFTAQVGAPTEVSSGQLYSALIDPININQNGNPMVAILDPYICSWKAVDATRLNSVNRHTSEIFIVNTSILSAIEDVKRMVMKARTTLFGFDDMLFDQVTILGWMRRGRDLFNSQSGYITEFSMTNATGGIREYWLRYSEVAMLLAQALAEGEKAFNYSGQAISLEVDKSQAYQSMADALQSRIDADVKAFKQNLLKKGITGGDGNISGAAVGGRSSMLGLSLHAASQFGRAGYNWPR